MSGGWSKAVWRRSRVTRVNKKFYSAVTGGVKAYSAMTDGVIVHTRTGKRKAGTLHSHVSALYPKACKLDFSTIQYSAGM